MVAGAVVGTLAGVALLIALAVWLTRRHLIRHQQQERTIPQEDFEVDATDGPDTILTPYVDDGQGSTPSKAFRSSAAAPLTGNQANQRSVSPMVVQEEDAEDVKNEMRPVEVLPPRYRSAWRNSEQAAGGSTSPVLRSEKSRPST